MAGSHSCKEAAVDTAPLRNKAAAVTGQFCDEAVDAKEDAQGATGERAGSLRLVTPPVTELSCDEAAGVPEHSCDEAVAATGGAIGEGAGGLRLVTPPATPPLAPANQERSQASSPVSPFDLPEELEAEVNSTQQLINSTQQLLPETDAHANTDHSGQAGSNGEGTVRGSDVCAKLLGWSTRGARPRRAAVLIECFDDMPSLGGSAENAPVQGSTGEESRWLHTESSQRNAEGPSLQRRTGGDVFTGQRVQSEPGGNAYGAIGEAFTGQRGQREWESEAQETSAEYAPRLLSSSSSVEWRDEGAPCASQSPLTGEEKASPRCTRPRTPEPEPEDLTQAYSLPEHQVKRGLPPSFAARVEKGVSPRYASTTSVLAPCQATCDWGSERATEWGNDLRSVCKMKEGVSPRYTASMQGRYAPSAAAGPAGPVLPQEAKGWRSESRTEWLGDLRSVSECKVKEGVSPRYAASNAQFPLGLLPHDCLALILSYCPLPQIARLSCVNTAWWAAAEGARALLFGRMGKVLTSHFGAAFPQIRDLRSGQELSDALFEGTYSTDQSWMLSLDPESGAVSLHGSAAKLLNLWWANGEGPVIREHQIRHGVPGSDFASCVGVMDAQCFEIFGGIQPPFSLPSGWYQVSWKVAKAHRFIWSMRPASTTFRLLDGHCVASNSTINSTTNSTDSSTDDDAAETGSGRLGAEERAEGEGVGLGSGREGGGQGDGVGAVGDGQGRAGQEAGVAPFSDSPCFCHLHEESCHELEDVCIDFRFSGNLVKPRVKARRPRNPCPAAPASSAQAQAWSQARVHGQALARAQLQARAQALAGAQAQARAQAQAEAQEAQGQGGGGQRDAPGMPPVLDADMARNRGGIAGTELGGHRRDALGMPAVWETLRVGGSTGNGAGGAGTGAGTGLEDGGGTGDALGMPPIWETFRVGEVYLSDRGGCRSCLAAQLSLKVSWFQRSVSGLYVDSFVLTHLPQR